MILILEVCGQPAAKLGAGGRGEFRSAGGLIGRVPNNDWVLPGQYVSGHHARIQFRNGQFFVEDTSTNGVFLNSPENRLQRGRPYPLKAGDRLFIDTYEINVSVKADEAAHEPVMPAAAGGGSRKTPFIPDDPFAVDVPDQGPPIRGAAPAVGGDPFVGSDDPFAGISDAMASNSEADPLKALGLEDRRSAPAVRAPRASELASGSPLSDNYRPPPVRPLEVVEPPLGLEEPVAASPIPDERASPAIIPADYDPLAPDPGVASAALPPAPPARPAPAAPPASRAPVAGAAPRVTPAPPQNRAPAPTSRQPGRPAQEPAPASAPQPGRAHVASGAPARVTSGAAAPAPAAPPRSSADLFADAAARRDSRVQATDAPRDPAPRAAPAGGRAATPDADDFDLGALLEGAGLQGVVASPELARNFGQILRVVIAGLMDVLRARERIKDEFRLRVTTFKATHNNPLKFSANVDDALHNLLVKRNPAYLGPVEAFEDAFCDVRNHQMAMLAGVRVAYEAMLAEFDPETLQAEFDRQLKKGSFLSAPARLRYWELYGDLFRGRVRDADSCFRELFGDEFAKAYEEQLEKLRALQRSGGK